MTGEVGILKDHEMANSKRLGLSEEQQIYKHPQVKDIPVENNQP